MKVFFPSIICKVEKWKWNREYRVYVSTLGNFKDEHKNRIPIKVNGSGYCVIQTYRHFVYAHRLVMLTWKPIPNAESLTVDHLDHNKRNNSLDNLEWVSRGENERRAKEDFLDNSCEIESEEECGFAQNPNRRPIIHCVGRHKYFVSLLDAANWVCSMNFPNITPQSAMRRIAGAIDHKTKAYGYLWRVSMDSVLK